MRRPYTHVTGGAARVGTLHTPTAASTGTALHSGQRQSPRSAESGEGAVSGVDSSQHETRRRVDRTHRKLPQNRMGHSPTSSQHSGAAVQILHMRASLDRHSLTLLQAVVYGPAAGTSVRLGMIVYLLRCQCFCSSPESTPGDQRRRRLGLRRDSVSARLCFGVLWWSASAWAEMQYLLRRRGAEHG